MKMELSERNLNHVTTNNENQDEKPLPREFKHATTNFETFLVVSKTALGSGLLATPDAFKNAGLGLGLVGSAMIVLVITHASAILVRSSQFLCLKLKKPFLTYYETAEYAFEQSSIPSVRPYSAHARGFVKGVAFITYFGVDSVYIVLVAASAKQIIENQIDIDWNIRWYILLVLILILPIGVIKLMKCLAPVSAFAGVCLFSGLAIILYKIVGDLPPISSRPLVAPLEKIPLFLSTILFGCEGIGIVLPAENEMRNPDSFLGWTGVLSWAMFCVGSVSAAVGFIGYLKFGDEVAGSISLNLEGDWLAELVKILIALAIFFSYGLQMTVTAEVAWDSVKDYFQRDNSTKAYYYVRASLVVGSAVVAVVVPNLAPIISLFGAIGFSMMGLFCPAVIDFVLFYEPAKGLANVRCWIDVLFITFALIAAVLGTCYSLADIIANYQ